MAQLGHNVFTGTNVSDANEVNLLTGATLNAAGTTNSTAVQVDRPGRVAFVLTTGTVTGTTPTLALTIQGADTSAFTAGTIVTLGTANSTGTAQSSKTISVDARAYKGWVRVVVVAGGTSPVYTGSTLYIKQPSWRRTKDTTAATLI